MFSSWISCDMISPSIMAKLLAKTEAAWWGCFGPTRGRISDEKCSRNARWTISCETKSSLLSLVFSWMWLLSELPEVAQLSFYHLWPYWWSVDPNCWKLSLRQMAQESAGSCLKACPSKRGGLEALSRLPSLKLLGPWKLPETQQGQDRRLHSQFSGALAVRFREGKSGKFLKNMRKTSCHLSSTTSVGSSDLVISSSWSRELQITSINLLKTSGHHNGDVAGSVFKQHVPAKLPVAIWPDLQTPKDLVGNDIFSMFPGSIPPMEPAQLPPFRITLEAHLMTES